MISMPRLLAAITVVFAASVNAADTLPSLESLLEKGQVDTAIETLEQDLGGNPFDPVQLNNLAVARVRKGEVYTALDLLDRATRLAPEDTVIADNRKQLRAWIASRIGANADRIQANARPIPSTLPDPPALWSVGNH